MLFYSQNKELTKLMRTPANISAAIIAIAYINFIRAIYFILPCKVLFAFYFFGLSVSIAYIFSDILVL